MGSPEKSRSKSRSRSRSRSPAVSPKKAIIINQTLHIVPKEKAEYKMGLSTLQMIVKAIKYQKERKGSSVPAIKKHIEAYYMGNQDIANQRLRDVLAKGVKTGILVKSSGTRRGATERFKLAKPGFQETTSKKPKTTKKAKKPKAKKIKKNKKVTNSPKKTAKPKKAKKLDKNVKRPAAKKVKQPVAKKAGKSTTKTKK